MNIWHLGLVLILFNASALSLPWISNRFAQNCAACHSPGRLNREVLDRRCTLSCQGCHVNPNGGGLRNRYGVWTQQRWLRSYRLDVFGHKYKPAPYAEQTYIKDKSPAPPEGHPLIVSFNEDSEKRYDRSDGSENSIELNEANHRQRMAKQDPFREERQLVITGGGDFRYSVMTRSRISTGEQARAWLMDVDFGIRVRPIQEKLSLVFESRTLNQPTSTALLQGFTSESRIRSAYALVDDLPLNSYVMYGLYRPMFGWYTPDHYSLSQTLSGLGARATFNSFGFGTAPNVPFANVNIIFPSPGTGYDKSSGFVLNVGGRWVTMGASVLFSVWNTKMKNVLGNQLKREMYSLSGGLTYDRFIWNGELLRVKRERSVGLFDAGNVYTNEFMGRFYREFYGVLNLSFSNVSRDLSEGSSKEIMLGVRSFFLSGTEAELLWVKSVNSTASTTLESSLIQAQIHLFL